MWNYTPRFAKSTAHICLEMWWIHMERVAEHQAVWCGMWSCCFLPLILSMETGWMFFQQSHIGTCTLLESVWGILLRFQVLEGTYLSTRQDFFQHHFYHVVGYKCGGFCVIIANSHDITKVIEDSLMKWNMTYVYGCVSIWGSLRSQLHSKVSNHKKKTTTTTRTTTKKRKKNQHKNRNKETRTPKKSALSPWISTLRAHLWPGAPQSLDEILDAAKIYEDRARVGLGRRWNPNKEALRIREALKNRSVFKELQW